MSNQDRPTRRSATNSNQRGRPTTSMVSIPAPHLYRSKLMKQKGQPQGDRPATTTPPPVTNPNTAATTTIQSLPSGFPPPAFGDQTPAAPRPGRTNFNPEAPSFFSPNGRGRVDQGESRGRVDRSEAEVVQVEEDTGGQTEYRGDQAGQAGQAGYGGGLPWYGNSQAGFPPRDSYDAATDPFGRVFGYLLERANVPRNAPSTPRSRPVREPANPPIAYPPTAYLESSFFEQQPGFIENPPTLRSSSTPRPSATSVDTSSDYLPSSFYDHRPGYNDNPPVLRSIRTPPTTSTLDNQDTPSGARAAAQDQQAVITCVGHEVPGGCQDCARAGSCREVGHSASKWCWHCSPRRR